MRTMRRAGTGWARTDEATILKPWGGIVVDDTREDGDGNMSEGDPLGRIRIKCACSVVLWLAEGQKGRREAVVSQRTHQRSVAF